MDKKIFFVQKNEVEGSSSEPSPVYFRVPQGTILSPLLFPLIYVPNIFNSNFWLYADDALVYLILLTVAISLQ